MSNDKLHELHAVEGKLNRLAGRLYRSAKASQYKQDVAMDRLDNLCCALAEIDNIESDMRDIRRRLKQELERKSKRKPLSSNQDERHPEDSETYIIVELDYMRRLLTKHVYKARRAYNEYRDAWSNYKYSCDHDRELREKYKRLANRHNRLAAACVSSEDDDTSDDEFAATAKDKFSSDTQDD